MSKAWAKGSTRRWRVLRQEVLDYNRGVQGGLCQLEIGGVCTRVATQVHHTLGRNVTADDRRYLIAVCAECNRYVGDPTKFDPQPKKMTRW
jgi:hypothetical protein